MPLRLGDLGFDLFDHFFQHVVTVPLRLIDAALSIDTAPNA